MLVLTRREGESVVIGNDVCVTVEKVEGGRCRLSFDAPDFVAIVRSELLDVLREDSNRQRTMRYQATG